MSNAALDRLLAVLVAAAVATGALALRSGSPAWGAVFVGHDVLAGILLGTVLVKLRRSVPRAAASGHRWRLGLGLALALIALGAIVGGFAWVASGSLLTIESWTVLTIHAWLGMVLGPIAVLHLLPRRWRLLRPRLGPQRGPAVPLPTRRRISRRAVLQAASVGALGVIAWLGAAAAERVAGGTRRFTGSRWLEPNRVPPATTFLGEAAPPIDVGAWRLRVHGRVDRPLELDLASLEWLGTAERTAVLDCTSGWAVETTWSGVPLGTLLTRASPAPEARRVIVRSVTGWSAELAISEVQLVLLATGVAGARLPAANGAPCRLVVPDHRGLDWVKWVAEVEVA